MRDRPGIRDWALTAVIIVVVTAYLVGAGRILWEVANNRATTEALWLPVGLVCAGVIATQVWKRTVWGRQPSE